MHLDLIQLAGVLATAWAGGRLAARLGFAPVVGEILAGLVLGPPVLGLLAHTPAVDALAQVGVLLLMLYLGMETDPRELRRASWAGLVVAVGGFMVPFGLALGVVHLAGGSALTCAFVGVAAGVTSIATKARVLVDLGIVDTRIANVMMSGAVWTDLASLIAFGGLLAVAAGGAGMGVGWPMLGTLALAVAAATTARVVLPRVSAWITRNGAPSRSTALTLAVIFGVAMGALAEITGLHGILGAFLAGLLLREDVFGRQLAADLRQAVHDSAVGFLAPVFFVTIAFDVSLDALAEAPGLVVTLIVVASVGKVVGTAVAYLPTRRGWREAVVLGVGMNDRGAVEIVMAGVALREGLIGPTMFGALVVLAVTTTAVAPVMLRAGVRWLDGRGELVRARATRRGVLVIGASERARQIAQRLRAAGPVCLVDSNAENVRLARAEGLEAVHGDALDEEVLAAAGASEAAVLVAMTRNPGLNALVARLARAAFGVPDVQVRVLDRDADAIVAKYLRASLVGDDDLRSTGT